MSTLKETVGRSCRPHMLMIVAWTPLPYITCCITRNIIHRRYILVIDSVSDMGYEVVFFSFAKAKGHMISIF